MIGRWPILDVLLDVDWSRPDPMRESLDWIAGHRRERAEAAAVRPMPRQVESVGDLFEKPKKRKAG